MGDFLLDFRDRDARRQSIARATALLSFCPDTRTQVIERDAFSLLLTRPDGFHLWGPFSGRAGDGEVLVALAGRTFFGQQEWDEASRMDGDGGLACKLLFQTYVRGGVDAVAARLNGNAVAFIHDARDASFHLITDRCGMFLAYAGDLSSGPLVFSSHPDALASALGESQNWDLSSLAEFLMTSRLSFPFTYYRKISALELGSIYSIGLRGSVPSCRPPRRYFSFDFQIDPAVTEDELAQHLATAFRNSVKRRTLPLFGRTAVALSGGLDSRAILSASGGGNHVFAFTLFDEENTEFKTAQAVAQACGAEMVPVRREFDYYGRSADLGVRISGGTGSISCNHFLGVRSFLRQIGTQNLLTGCYCDYLLKGLDYNTTEAKVTRVQSLAPFQFDFYDGYSPIETGYRDRVLRRLATIFPETPGRPLLENTWLDVGRRRSFPLAYEQDLAQRTIPQRVLPWSLPVIDNDILAVYLRIPPRFKLNASIFRKMVRLICPPEVAAIQNSNTGARADASWAGSFISEHLSSLRNRVREKLRPGLATRGSWPNWQYYIHHSPVIRDLWMDKGGRAAEIFSGLLGWDPFSRPLHSFHGADTWLFVRLFTQKLWLDNLVRPPCGLEAGAALTSPATAQVCA
jgi:asparagine synthase (glutamine-hydrolysing)